MDRAEKIIKIGLAVGAVWGWGNFTYDIVTNKKETGANVIDFAWETLGETLGGAITVVTVPVWGIPYLLSFVITPAIRP